MSVLRDIDYGRAEPHERRRGDFFPVDEPEAPPCLMIHGGGWNAQSKESIEPVARRFQEHGIAVFSVNYRLLQIAPWPGCLKDCEIAARFVLEGGLGPTPDKILIAGASAGGHLAMMTGRALGRSTVDRIISVAGPSCVDNRHGTNSQTLFRAEFLQTFFGVADVTPDLIETASPLKHSEPPPSLICLHSANDRFVPIGHSQAAVEAWEAAGAKSFLQVFDGPGDLHGLWDSEDMLTRAPSREFAASLDKILSLINKR